jgi:hypothetical protein
LSPRLHRALGYNGNRTEGLYFRKEEKKWMKRFHLEVASADEDKAFSSSAARALTYV